MEHSEETHLLEIEKVIVLKSTELFAETDNDLLVEIARLVHAVRFEKGDRIFRKGDLGKDMYIIYEGSVSIHDGSHELIRLKRRDFFGELALLDPEPRSADATASEDSLLLKLEQDPFYELMEERIEVCKGILKVLSRRIRNNNKLIAALRTEKVQS